MPDEPKTPTPPGTPDPKDGTGGPDLAAEVARLKAENEALKATKPKPEDDLRSGAAKDREDRERASQRDRQLESSVKFDLSIPAFLKENEKILPAEFADIVERARKETFSDAIEKDQAIKTGLIQSFFAVQGNVDLLTPGQRAELDGYLKLTKAGKQEKAQSVFDMVFEPAFKALKDQKRAAALHKGHGAGSESDYEKRLKASSEKHYFGGKNVT